MSSIAPSALQEDGQIGLKNLINEPTRLKREGDRVNMELEALVMENYKIFVENLTCSVHLKYEVSCA
jgi:hypothetical protein